MANKTSLKNVLAFIGLALLYVVLVFICEFIGYASPWCWMLFPALAAFVAAWPVFKAVDKTGGKNVFLLFGVVFVLTYYLEYGESTVLNTVVSLVVAVAAEIVHRTMGCGSRKALRIAYPVFSFLPLGMIVSLWLNNDKYCQAALGEMGETYCEKMSHLGNVWTFALTAVAIIVLASVAVKIFYKKK